jgi:hypothetical protein
VRRTEVFLDRLSCLFGKTPKGWRSQYYRHPSVAELSARVGYPVSGVTDITTGRIDSALDYHPHELVHAVAGRLGRPPAILAEGLAVALSSRGLWGGGEVNQVAAHEITARGSLEPFLTAFGEEDPAIAHAVAGSFVAFLLDQDGIEPMPAFLRGCGAPQQTHEAAFSGAYGSSVARRTAEWMAWLRQGEGALERAWYEPGQWPGTLLRHPPGRALAAAAAETSRPPAWPSAGASLLAAAP